MLHYEWGYTSNGNLQANPQAKGTSTLNLIAMKTGAVYQFAMTVVMLSMIGLMLI